MKPEAETNEKSESGNKKQKLNRKKCRKSRESLILGWWITSRSFYSWTALNVLTKQKRKTFSWDMPWENIHRAVFCLTKALTNLLKVGKSQRVFSFKPHLYTIVRNRAQPDLAYEFPDRTGPDNQICQTEQIFSNILHTK